MLYFTVIYSCPYIISASLYEINKGDTDKMRSMAAKSSYRFFDKREFLKCKKYCCMMCEDFDTIKRTKEKKNPWGIVGEIYVKYSLLQTIIWKNFCCLKAASL